MKCKRMYFYSRYLIYSLSSLSLHHSHVHDVGRPIPSARPPKHDARFQSAQFHERRVSRLRLGLGPIHRVHEPDDVIPGAIARCIPRAALAPVSSRGASLGGWRPTDQPHSSSKDSTSLSDASAVNRRESSTQGRARARLSSEVILRRSSSRVDVSRTNRGRERSLGGEIA